MNRSIHGYVLAILTFVLSVSLAANVHAALRVVTTTTDVAALAEIIGGDRVEVEAIAKGYQDPHYLEAKPSHMIRLRDADLLAYVGLELEVGWLPLILDGARNPSIRVGERGHLAMANGIEVLEVPTGEISRSEGDVHPFGNPHYWLDPHNLLPMARTLADRLALLDPEHADEYQHRREDFERRLRERITVWDQRMAPYRGESVVCYHKQWEYLFDWLGIEIAGYIEAKAGIPPSPRHVNELQELIASRNIRVLVISNFFEPGPAERIAERTGAQVVILPASVKGEEGLDDPFTFFDALVEDLVTAFETSSR